MQPHALPATAVANLSRLEPVLISWRHLMAQGRRSLQADNYLQATTQLQQALRLAELLFDQWHVPDEAMAIHVMSHHVMADALRHQGELEGAAGYLCAIHRRLQELSADKREPSDRREAAWRYLHQTMDTLRRFAAQHSRQTIWPDLSLH